ncbi:energy-coupling factor transporter ATPase [Butyrivibrio sp. MC2013]|uniref:energy-coupling factor transporter ATPase n=1 Tax=Butyrivibrio sp. MC2013 TaxID=1280686 RepID=UPI000420D758|nr:energy-coupling factor transporter ATPase [Butyrivibrio sp. MC2013]
MSLKLDNVSYIYESGTNMERKALENINLEISKGEFIGIIGHTGSGKSTLVTLLNGLISPSGGSIYWDGQDINDKSFDRKMLRSKVGLVFQYPEHQLFEADVFSDVCFGPKNLGLSADEVKERAYRAIKDVHLDDKYLKQSPFELSGGQKRRVAIAGVLAMGPEILVLDEPCAGLDPKGRNEILDLLSSLHENEGITVVLVSHSMEDVADHADRIVVMDKGHIVYDEAPKRVFGHVHELEEMGLSVPEVTYIMNDLADEGFAVSRDVTTIDEAVAEIKRLVER